MTEVFFKATSNLSAEEPDSMRLTVVADATALDTMLSVAALARHLWLEYQADDPMTAELFRTGLLRALSAPGFWSREEESSHD